jgi:5-methylcytosine-specific restriction enzyme subunit McrC
LIIWGRSLTFRDGRTSSTGFLFDMNRVFEDFVGAALAPHFRAAGVRLSPQRTDHLDEMGAIQIRPDLTWWRWGRCLGVADVKYKSLATNELPNADVYQTLAYSIAHARRQAHLIYAAGNEPAAVHVVRHVGTTISVHALDLSGEPGQILKRVRDLFEAIHP